MHVLNTNPKEDHQFLITANPSMEASWALLDSNTQRLWYYAPEA